LNQRQGAGAKETPIKGTKTAGFVALAQHIEGLCCFPIHFQPFALGGAHMVYPQDNAAMDALITTLDTALRTLFADPHAARPMPKPAATFDVRGADDVLAPPDRVAAGRLMRVNHVGEVCAQALYSAQSLATNNEALRAQFAKAAAEETDHLAWTASRLSDLGARPSLLNPLWYAGAFGLGLVAGRLGDQLSLAFLVETESQVEAHLQSHLEQLPAADHASRAVVAQMRLDEARHALEAQHAGALELPAPVKGLMAAAAKVMTTVAARV
jgi:3-demethoxyubiquinol 3-hydroxylase